MDEQSKIIKRLKITLAPCASDGGKTGLRFAWACFFFFFIATSLYSLSKAAVSCYDILAL